MASAQAAFFENGRMAPQRQPVDEYAELEKIVQLREMISSGQHAKYKPKPKVAMSGNGLPSSKPATPVPIPPPSSVPFKPQPIQVYPNNLNSEMASVPLPFAPPPQPSSVPPPPPAQLAAQQRELQQQKLHLQKLMQQRQQEQQQAQLERERENRKREQERIDRERQEKERLQKERLERERVERERIERERLERERQERERLERERQERERLERERQERERQERERFEREKLRESKEREKRERERLELEKKEQERRALEESVGAAVDQEMRNQERRRQQELAARMLPQPFKRRFSSTQHQTLTKPPQSIQPTSIITDKKVLVPQQKPAISAAQATKDAAVGAREAVNAERKRLEMNLQAQLDDWKTRKMRIGDPVLDPALDVGLLLEKAQEIANGVLPPLPGGIKVSLPLTLGDGSMYASSVAAMDLTKDDQPPYNAMQTPSNDDASTRPDESQRASSEGLYSPPEYIQSFDDAKRTGNDAPMHQDKRERRTSTNNREVRKPSFSGRRPQGDDVHRDRETPKKAVPDRGNHDLSSNSSTHSSDAPSVGSASSSVPKKRARPLDESSRSHASAGGGIVEPVPKRAAPLATQLPETIIILDDDDKSNGRKEKSDGSWQRPTVPRSKMSPKPPQIKKEQAPDSPTMTIPRPTPTPEPHVVPRVEYLVERPRYYPQDVVYYDPAVRRSRYMPHHPGYEVVYGPPPSIHPAYEYHHPYDYPYHRGPRYAYVEDPYYDPGYHYARRPPPSHPSRPPVHGQPHPVPPAGSPGMPLSQRFESPPPAHQPHPNDLPPPPTHQPPQSHHIPGQQQPADQPSHQQPGPHPPLHHAPQPIADMYAPYEDIEMRSRRMPPRRSRSPPPEHARARYERCSRSRSPPRDTYGPPVRYHPEDYRASGSVIRRPGSPEYVKVYARPPPRVVYEYHPAQAPHGRPVYVHDREPLPPTRVVYYESRRPDTRHPEVVYYDRPPPQAAPHPKQQASPLPPSPRQQHQPPPQPSAPQQGPPPQQPPPQGPAGGEQATHRPIRYAAEPEVLPHPRVYRERDYPYPPPHHPYHPHEYERMEVPRPDQRYVRSAAAAAPPREYYASEIPPEGNAYPRPTGHEQMPPDRYYA